MTEEAMRNRAEGTSWKEVLLPAYEVRKRKEQKTAFIDMLKTHFGDRMRMETCGSFIARPEEDADELDCRACRS